MRIHWLQHVDFEGLGAISEWIEHQRHSLSVTRLYRGESLPAHEGYDMLIVMGGPMGIYDDTTYSWLAAEKTFIREAVEGGKVVLGMCLGAQLLADALGAKVRPNGVKEIGWFEITRNDDTPAGLQDILPPRQTVFHWHGDTFSLPPGAVALYRSKACIQQAFVYNNRVVGLQFHLEIGRDQLQPLIANCRHELQAGEWIQPESLLEAGARLDYGCKKMLFQLLDYLGSPGVCQKDRVVSGRTLR
jgi:GMP synthase-like glutamine amidotransferase